MRPSPALLVFGTLIVLLALPTAAAQLCGVATAPLSCGGQITYDATQGACRTVNCISATGGMTAMGCDKPDGQAPQYIELYRQSSWGAPPRFCMGDACVQENGYARSSSCAQQLTCSYNGATYQNGQTFPKGDGCNTCSCSSGQVSCTSNSCQPSSCFSSVTQMPVTCAGAPTTAGRVGETCMSLGCSDQYGTITVLACDKPDSGTKQYFEIYRQAATGDPPAVCFGGTCVEENGYARSANFPICTGTTSAACTYNGVTYQSGQAFPKGDGCNMCSCANGQVSCTSNDCPPSTCRTSVKQMPVTCAGIPTTAGPMGDTCISLGCSDAGGTITMLACDKPDAGAKQYYEVYRQAYTGTPPQVCVGSACIKENGYARSANFPIC